MTPSQLAEQIAKVMDAKLAKDIAILDVTELTTIADYFVICTGNSPPHIKALSDEIEKVLKKDGITPHHVEGYMSGGWVLLDYSDVIVHIFLKETREFYELERLWRDARHVDVGSLLKAVKI